MFNTDKTLHKVLYIFGDLCFFDVLVDVDVAQMEGHGVGGHKMLALREVGGFHVNHIGQAVTEQETEDEALSL